MIAFVLDDAGMKPIHGPVDRTTELIEALISELLPAGNDTAKAGNGKTPFPPLLRFFR